MTGKTHTAVGVASSLLILGNSVTDKPVQMFIGVSIASVAAIMPDIDIKKSRNVKHFFLVEFLTPLLTVLYLVFSGVRLNSATLGSSVLNLTQIVIALIAFYVLVSFGKRQPHREFTHSFIALLAFSLVFSILIKEYWLWFTISYISHILIDLLNKKSVHLLWPLDLGNVCLNLCGADGAVNNILCSIGTAFSAICIILNLSHLILR